MNLFECIRIAFSSLIANKLRALLTMLGIIIGVSAVITITTLGSSLQKTLKNSFDTLGMNFISLSITQKSYDPDNYMGIYLSDDDLIQVDQMYGLVNEYPDRFALILSDSLGESEIINESNQTIKNSISGISDGYLDYMTLKIVRGRNISQADCLGLKHTMLVSDIFVGQYFKKNENPIGQTLEFTMSDGVSQKFTIVGVYHYSTAMQGKFEPNTPEIEKVTPVYIPYDTALDLKGESAGGRYWAEFMIKPAYDFDESYAVLRDYFDECYSHNKYWTVDYYDPHDDFKIINKILLVVTSVIAIIAMISLLVGGVGVMNIMLVSVTERTKEIGVRKALGAKNSNIRLQFVVESIIICLTGGVIGIIIGVINGFIVKLAAEIIIKYANQDIADILTITVSPSVIAIVISVIFSMMIGVFFGYYPANKAAKMNPIDALRYD